MGGDKIIRFVLCVVSIFSFVFELRAQSSKLTFKSDSYTTNFDTGETIAEGNVKIQIGVQNIEAERVRLNNKTGVIYAESKVVYKKDKLTIKSEKAEFNMESGYGTFSDAILTVENEFYLEARTLRRSGEKSYLAIQGKLTSCQDCPKSWSFVGASIELELENFAKIHHGFAQVLDQPILYFPFFLFPVKTVRQSGLLFPKMSFNSELGFSVRQPYFFAPEKNWDITPDYRFMTNGGHGIGVEARYALGDRSFYNLRSSYSRNLGVINVPENRGAIVAQAFQQLTPEWSFRLSSELASDARYPRHFSEEFLYYERPSLQTKPQLNWQNTNHWFELSSEWHIDNVPRAVVAEQGIYKLPEASFRIPSKRLFDLLRTSLDVESTHFMRPGLGYDRDTLWIREGKRHSWISSLSYPLDLGSWVKYNFKLEARGDAYQFGDLPSDETQKNAFRFRTQMEQEVNTELFKVFPVSSSGDLKAVKHSWFPLARWSYSPPDAKTDHAFFEVNNSPRFDLFDPNSPEVSVSALGLLPEEKKFKNHHLFTLGLGTRVVGRYGEQQKVYQEFFSANIEQDLSLMDDNLDRPSKISANLAYGPISLATKINLYVFGDRKGEGYFENSLKYGFWKAKLELGQTIVPEREVYFTSLGLGNLGPWATGMKMYFDGLTKDFYGRALTISYNSNSKCWYAEVTFREEWNARLQKNTFGIYPTFQVFFDETKRFGI